jgi:hypothetical protein
MQINVKTTYLGMEIKVIEKILNCIMCSDLFSFINMMK